MCRALSGIEVVLIDAKQEAADKGKAHSEGLLDKGMARKKVTAEKKAEVLGRITATTDYAALKGCDLVVEAVFEDIGVKAEVTAKAEAAIADSAIFATNTSTLPISELAKASKRPDQFIGIHFFSPVDKMMLVEIIRGKQTGDVAVAKSLDFVRQIRKTPIVVNDARFFYANRCIIPYINEGIRMVAEGVEPVLVENAAKLVGMPLGPLQLVDETSIDLGVKIAKATRAAMGDAYPDGAVDEVLFALADQGRLGRKSASGFYAYDDKGGRIGPVGRSGQGLAGGRRSARCDSGAAPPADGAGAGSGARAGGWRADRYPRRRCRRDPGLGLCALVGRAVFLAGYHRRGTCRRDLRCADQDAWARGSRRRTFCARWPRRARRSTGGSAGRRRRPEARGARGQRLTAGGRCCGSWPAPYGDLSL